MTRPTLAPWAALALACVLAGCGTTAVGAPQARTAAALAARAADADRPAPPAAEAPGKAKQGFAARQSARSAERSLYRYGDLLSQWERARTDAEKDRIEQDMLYELNTTLSDIVQMTSQQGHDQADRDAYDLGDRALDRYDRLYREWQAARTDEQKRRIVNEMLTGMVEALQAIKRIA